MKKIFEFIPKMTDGGAETLVKDYCIALSDRGYNVQILTVYKTKKSANVERIRNNGIREISIYNNDSLITKIHRRLFGRWYIPYKLHQIIKKEKPEIIHAHLETLHYLKSIGSELDGVSLFFTCHSEPDKALGGKKTNEFDAVKYLIKHNNLQLIALHNEMASKLNKMFNINSTLVLHNGINLNAFDNIKIDKTLKRSEIGIPQDAYVIGHVGRFVKCKNHEFIIEIFNRIVELNCKAYLLLIGEGPCEKEILERVRTSGLEGRVRFLKKRKDIPELLHCMDAFVFPSFYEGFPITLIEAQAAQLKTVVSDVINDEVLLTNNITKMSLNHSAYEWAVELLKQPLPDDNWNNINLQKFDMNYIVDELLKIYIQ